MLSSFAACFSRVFPRDQKAENKEPNVTNFVYRDKLNRNPPSKKGKKGKKGKKVSFASSVHVKPQVEAGGKGGKNLEGSSHASISTGVEEKAGSVIRVKVTMTKAEAARLLSKCKDGGVLGFTEATNELLQIPMNRVDVMCPSTCPASVLKTIPE